MPCFLALLKYMTPGLLPYVEGVFLGPARGPLCTLFSSRDQANIDMKLFMCETRSVIQTSQYMFGYLSAQPNSKAAGVSKSLPKYQT